MAYGLGAWTPRGNEYDWGDWTPRVSRMTTPGGFGALGNVSGYGYASDPILRQLRDMGLADAAAGQRGARSAARVSAGNDPSAAAGADLSAYIGGLSDTSRNLMGAAYSRLAEKDRRAWDEWMMRERARLEEEALRKQNQWGWLGDLTSFAGDIGGAMLMPRTGT